MDNFIDQQSSSALKETQGHVGTSRQLCERTRTWHKPQYEDQKGLRSGFGRQYKLLNYLKSNYK